MVAEKSLHPPHDIPKSFPLQLTSFVGRRTELAEARNLVSVFRLVTLTGIGGVGKTRLVLQIAANVRQNFADGVWVVELAEIHDDSLVIDAVAAALGIREQAMRRFQDVVVEFLESRTTLLVLDNCEQVAGAVTTLVEALLRACPNIRILTTAREPLGISGESVFWVSPLEVPDLDRELSLRWLLRCDAVALFVDRAVAAVPGFVLSEENMGLVADICQRLDGLPLAIELAAARIRMMSPKQILQRLDDRYALLTRGSRSSPTRQQTLRLSVDWSYDSCSPREQKLWNNLTVFAGTIELDAIEKVTDADMESENLLNSLSSLVEKSILIREELNAEVHFRLLPTLRDYGREKLQNSGEYELIRRRHRDWYLRLALDAEGEWFGPRQLELIDRLDREHPNFREVMDYCLADGDDDSALIGLRIATVLYQFPRLRGLYGEGRSRLKLFLAQSSTNSTIIRIRAIHAASHLAAVQGDLTEATALVEGGRTLAAQLTDPIADAFLDDAEGQLALRLGDFSRSIALLENAREVFESSGDLTLQAALLQTRGFAYELIGESNRSIESFERILTLTQIHRESVHRSFALRGIGIVLWRGGNSARAAKLLKEAVQLTVQIKDPHGCAMDLEALAWIAAGERKPQRAAVLMGAAEELRRSINLGTILVNILSETHEQCVEITRRKLGDRAFKEAQDQGRRMSMDSAVAYALGQQRSESISAWGSPATLTQRELQVSYLVAQGLTNRKIAEKLVISQRTAQGHVENILAKLGFTSRTQIAAWVVEQEADEKA
ncbi:ATP-binding protein [Rhodococcus erythropolis]|uniref:ATP-binding protein n=1 Tax=Rhodococcus erythropolis TaxID=1833 RepID=UPI00366F4FB7